MNTKRCRLVAKMILAGLALTTLHTNVLGGDLTQDEVTTLAVPRLEKAPTIDGVIDPAEWQGAAAISGPVDINGNVLLPRPTTFYLAWDAGHLYFACRTYLRPGYKPTIANGRSDGQAYVFDEGLELVFKPMGKNVTYVDAGAAYKLFLNALGNVGDLTRLELGQQLKNWGPKFKTAARLTAPGTAPDGGCWWELEVSTSTSDFNLKGNHQVGDMWKIMLGINHFPMWMQARSPCTGTYLEQEGYTRLKLVENVPAIQFTMDSLSNLASDGTASLTVKAFNPAKKAATVHVAVDVAGKVVKAQDLVLAAGGQAEFALAEKLPADIRKGKMRLIVKQADATLLNYTTYFDVGIYASMMAPVQPADPSQFAFKTTFNPVRNTLLVSGDIYYLPDPSSATGLQFAVKSEAGAEITKGIITNVAEWYCRDLISLPPLAAGKYVVEATLLLKDGKNLGPMKASIEKLDEAKTFPEWWGKNSGSAERVLPPFEAIRSATTGSFTCWGREYTLSALGLPMKLSSQGKAILAAPARIVVTRAGKTEEVPMGAATITDTKDWRVRFEGKAEGAGLAFSAKGWLEQDGLVYVDLTYAPLDGKPVTVDALRIEFPLTDEEADGVLCIGPGSNFSSITIKLTPREKTGLLWSTLETGLTGSGMALGSFYPTVWIGNEKRGFLWWGDNDRGWFPDNDIPAHELVRESGAGKGISAAVVLRNNIIGKPVTLDSARTVAFSYNATPFKPLQAGWRSWAATEDGTFFVPHRGVRADSKTGKAVNEGGQQRNWIHPESRYPEEWSTMWAEQKTNSNFLGFTGADACAAGWPFDPYAARNGIEWGHMSFALHGYGEKSLENRLYAYFGSEWSEGGIETWNESYSDYAMYLFERAFREGGVHSMYFDLTFPILIDNFVGGLAYRLPDGRLQRGYNGWNQRRFFMRLRALAYDNKLLPGCFGSHSSQAYVTVAMPWLDAVLDGERNWNLDLTDRDWTDNYPIERMRVMSSPHNWGNGICWMGNLDSTSEVKKAFGKLKQGEYVWMYDSWINPYMIWGGATRMPESALDWGLNGSNTVYVPFWRNVAASAKQDDILVSIWRMPGDSRVMLGVYNYNATKARDVKITLDLAALGLAKGEPVASDLYKPDGAGALKFEAGHGILKFDALPPHRVRLIGVAAVNPAARERATRALPAWATNGVTSAVLDYGFMRPETLIHESGKTPGVSCANAAIQVGMWQLPDRILVMVYNADTKAEQDAVLSVDLPALGLVPKMWQEFLRVRTWNKVGTEPDAILDYYAKTVTVKGLKPNTGRLVAIRKY